MRLQAKKRLILGFATGILIYFANISIDENKTPRQQIEKPKVEKVIKEENTPPVVRAMTVKETVKDYFENDPILIEIAKCESRFRQFDESGDVLRGTVTPEDIGVMQINKRYHLLKSKDLGYDIHTLDGNMAYAKWLYEKEGTKPWNSSAKCWSKYREIAKI